MEPGAVASEVARAAGIHASQLFRWRQLCQREPTPPAFYCSARAWTGTGGASILRLRRRY
jgi:transposase-like protein